MYYAIDSIFQPPIFMISSTAAPVRNVLGEPASYAKGTHHEVVLQLCRPQINGLAGRPSYGLLKEVDGPGHPSVTTTGNRCPAVRSDPYAMRQRCTP